MTDQAKMGLGEAIEVMREHCAVDAQIAEANEPPHPWIQKLRAALAAFDGWGEPIDKPFLRSLGFLSSDPPWVLQRLDMTGYLVAGEPDESVLFWHGSEEVATLKNRGDLLLLLHALGVEDEGVGE